MVTLKPSGEMTIRVCASMIVLVTIALALRMVTKSKPKTGLLIHDWLIILAACLFYTYTGLLLEGVLGQESGGSSNATELTLLQLDHFLKYLYAEEILFVITISTVKLSILLFYQHIFSVPSFRRLVRILAALCVVWLLVTFFIIIFQCSPIRAAWVFELQMTTAKCIPAGNIILGLELSNVILDILILCLPIYMIQRLQLPRSRKIIVSGIFLLGGFVCVTCIVRMYYGFDPNTHLPLSLSAAMDWSTVELASAIVCACLPTYGRLLKMLPTLPASVKSWYTTLRSTFRRSRPSKGSSTARDYNHSWVNAHEQLGDDANDRVHLTEVSGGAKAMHQYPKEETVHMNRINVQNTVEVV